MSEQTETIFSLNYINYLVFVLETEFAISEAGTKGLYIISMIACLQRIDPSQFVKQI
jgi:hypothetical protein